MIPFNLIINSLYEFSQITLAERSVRTCYPFGDQIEPKHETRKCSKQKRKPNFGSGGWTLKWSFKKVCCIDDSLSFVSFRVNLFMRTCALIMKNTWKISDIPTDKQTDGHNGICTKSLSVDIEKLSFYLCTGNKKICECTYVQRQQKSHHFNGHCRRTQWAIFK